jgi:hypothetical protein
MIASVTHDFSTNGPGQVWFGRGDKLVVIEWKYSDGWAHVSSLDGKSVGIFLQAFIDRSSA